jgi:hypothetical protein
MKPQKINDRRDAYIKDVRKGDKNLPSMEGSNKSATSSPVNFN